MTAEQYFFVLLKIDPLVGGLAEEPSYNRR
jgi:hypothetical protein